MKILRHAFASWSGPVESGSGQMRLGRAGAELPFSLKSRVEDTPATNPEELLGAAHAGCFSMSLSSMLDDAGHQDHLVSTDATVTMEEAGGSFTITRVALRTRGEVQGLSSDEFTAMAEKAKATCPVSKLFASAEITLTATLEQPAS
ncbi:MAG: OsmC family peroxiredoxin [Nakamurella sp.]